MKAIETIEKQLAETLDAIRTARSAKRIFSSFNDQASADIIKDSQEKAAEKMIELSAMLNREMSKGFLAFDTPQQVNAVTIAEQFYADGL